MTKATRLLSPRRWKKKHKNKKPSKTMRIKEKSESMRDLRRRSPQPYKKDKFMRKRASLWNLSSNKHETYSKHSTTQVHSFSFIVPDITTDSKHSSSAKHSSTSSYFELSSDTSDFPHLSSNDEPELPQIRSAVSLPSLSLGEMQRKIDGHNQHTTSGESSQSSVVGIKLERDYDESPNNLINLATWRVKKEDSTDLQISMWKIRTSQLKSLDMSDLMDYDRIVIEKTSPKRVFIQTSKIIKCH